MRKRVYKIMRALLCICLIMMQAVVMPQDSYADSDQKAMTNVTRASSVADLEDGGVYRIRNVATSRCLAAPTTRTSTSVTTTVTVETYSAGDPDQLWYISKQGGKYVIENLGVMDFASSGQYQAILNAGTGLQLGNNIYLSLGEKWSITSAGVECFYIKAYSTSEDKFLYSNGTTATLKNEDSSYSKWTLDKVSMDYYWDGGYTDYVNPSMSGVLDVNIIITEAVLGFASSTVYRSAEIWSDYCENVNVKVYFPTDTDIPDADVVVYVNDGGQSPNGAVASARIVAANHVEISGNDGVYDVVWNPILSIKLYKQEGSGFTAVSESWQKRVFIHEVGHILKLHHPHAYASSYIPVALMCQSEELQRKMIYQDFQQNTYTTLSLTGHDKATINEKWGG